MSWGKNVSSRTPSAFGIRHVVLTYLPARQSVAFSNRSNIVACLSVRGDVTTILQHRALSGIITREHQIDFTAEHIHQFLQVLSAGPDVFSGVKGLANTE